MKSQVLLAALMLSSSTPLPAAADAPPRTQTVVAGPHVVASPMRRFFFGADYRALWTTPVTAEVLDFSTEAGGLSVVRRIGGQETKGLALKGRDGRNYTFRGIQKDASSLLPEDLRETIAEDVLQDQMVGQHPASELVVRGLLDAVGIPCPSWRLVVLPDDPALGALRKDFAGAVGVFAEYPSAVSDSNPGFRGLTEIINHVELYQRLQAGGGDRADVTALLKCRLMDIFMGDWDRHRKQWRWAKFPDSPLWTPIPEDRDQAFSRYEGLVLELARDRDSRLQDFGPKVRGLGGLTLNGREQDRQLLTGLSREDFEQAASALKTQLTDTAIDRAVALMPEEWRSIDGPRLSRDLKARRDALPEIGEEYYRHLAHSVDVTMTDRDERVEARRQPNGDLDLSVRFASRDVAPSEPYFHRVFHPGETQDVRLYGLGGNDRFVVSGGQGPIRIRAIGGAGDDSLDDRAGGGTKLSDSEGSNAVVAGPGTSVDGRRYTLPPPPNNAPWLPPRDFGRRTWSLPRFGYGSDLGVRVGWVTETRGYGFRKDPYANRQVLRVDYSFGESGGRLDYRGEFRSENRDRTLGLRVYLSSVEVLRYYGFGNNTSNSGGAKFYKAQEAQALVFPSITCPVGTRARFEVGPLLRFSRTDDDQRNLLNATHPYGAGEFGQAGARAAVGLDSRDNTHYPHRGALLSASGAVWPGVWDVVRTFGEMNANGNAYLSIGNWLTLAARGGGKKVLGDAPYRDAASIGGGGAETGTLFEPGFELRGFRARRFAGDGALYGNADLRLRLFQATLIVPAHVGVFGLADGGRVWLDGENSDAWHSSFGGGLWVSLLKYRRTFSAYIAHSQEGNLFHVGSGFAF